MTSPVIKFVQIQNHIYISSFLMNYRESRRRPCHISNLELLDSRACHLSIHLINRAGGLFHSPPCLFILSSTLRHPSTQAQPPSSSSSSASPSGAASTWPIQIPLARLRHQTALVSSSSSPSVDLIRVCTNSWKLVAVLHLFLAVKWIFDGNLIFSLCGNSHSPFFLIIASLSC